MLKLHLFYNRLAKREKGEFLNGIQVVSHCQLFQTSHGLSVSFVLIQKHQDPRLHLPDVIGSDI